MHKSQGENRALTPKQKMFVEEYLTNDYNAREAYRTVFNAKSEDAVRVSSWQLMKKPHIKKAIADRLDDIIGDTDTVAKKMLNKLMEIAFANKYDETYTPKEVLNAINLLQKQLGLQTANVNAKVEAVIFAGEQELED